MAATETALCQKALSNIGITSPTLVNYLTDTSKEAVQCAIFYADERDSLLRRANWPFARRRATLAALPTVPVVWSAGAFPKNTLVTYSDGNTYLAITAAVAGNVPGAAPTVWQLVPTGWTPARSGWAYAFAVPSDMLLPRYISPAGLSQVLYTPVQPSQLSGVWPQPRTPRPDQRVPFGTEAATYTDDQILLCDYQTPELVYTAKLVDVTKFSAAFTDALAWALASSLAMPLTVDEKRAARAAAEAKASFLEALSEDFTGEQQDVPPDSDMIAARF